MEGEEGQNKNRTDPQPVLPINSKTRTSTAWFMTVGSVIGLVILLIFILQNLQDISIKFFGFNWKIPLGIAMLLAAVLGGVLVALFGTARVIQLRHRLRQNKN